jgi:SAM-dependent methyltransferase
MPDKSDFQTFYAGKAPWDIGKPQQPFIDMAGEISGSVLDAGCGTGDTAVFLAGRGCKVTGLDFLDVPIQAAKLKATERRVQITFLVKDVMTHRAVRQRSRQRPLSRLPRRGSKALRRGAYDSVEARWSPVPNVFQ